MKKLLLLLAVASSLFAAGTVTQTMARVGNTETFTLTLAFTADSADGSVPATILRRSGAGQTPDGAPAVTDGYMITQVITNPGSTAPTDNYDIVLTNDQALDLMGGNLANRDTSNTEVAVPGTINPVINGQVTFTLTNNSVNSATGVVIIYLSPAIQPLRASSGNGISDGDKGDIVVSSSGAALDIDSGVIVDADINASAAIDASKIGNGAVSTAEFQRLSTVTSDIQVQLDAKASAALAVTTTCSGASATFTATSNTINRFDCALVATNVTSSTLASLTSGALYTIVITQPGGGGITFAAPTGLTGFLPITTGFGDAANEVTTIEFVALSATTGRVVSSRSDGGTPGLCFANSSSGVTCYRGQTTGTNLFSAPTGTNTGFGSSAANTGTGAQDMSGASSTKPMKSGTSLPMTCSVGMFYNKTDATSTNVIYACTATDTWTAQGGGGGGGGNGTLSLGTGGCDEFSGVSLAWGMDGAAAKACSSGANRAAPTISFDDSGTDYITRLISLPGDIDVAEDVTFSIALNQFNGSAGGTVIDFGAELYCLNSGDSLTSYPTFNAAGQTGEVATPNADGIITTAAVDMTGCAAGDMAWIRIFRDNSTVGSNYSAGQLFIHHVTMHYVKQ